jgi:hypothetical protein
MEDAMTERARRTRTPARDDHPLLRAIPALIAPRRKQPPAAELAASQVIEQWVWLLTDSGDVSLHGLRGTDGYATIRVAHVDRAQQWVRGRGGRLYRLGTPAQD